MSDAHIIAGLLGYIFVREIFFLYSTNKLVNKIMSHSFYDYQQAKRVGKLDLPKPPKSEEDLEEDLGVLSGIAL